MQTPLNMYQKGIDFFKNTWFSNRFFFVASLVVVVFAFSFVFNFLFWVGLLLAVAIQIIALLDIFVLYYYSEVLNCERITPKLLSNGDENTIALILKNETNLNLEIDIYDELPWQLQKRDFHFKVKLLSKERQKISYSIRPTERGSYQFGNINLLFSSKIGLVQRRQIVLQTKVVAVYPSIIQMKKFELRSLEKASHFYGVKKIRRIGQSYEFEQIKDYVRGDDFRKINWKATSKRGDLMVNQYVEERSQMIYCFIDKSRSMKLPFYDLSLFDYAINSALVLSNVALQKQDKAGFVSFSNKIDSWVSASNKRGQLRRILEVLYNQEENFVESNYELLYKYTRKKIPVRSLVFLFTNFETMYSLDRQIAILRKLNKLHLLVVVIFENTEITHYLNKTVENVRDMYIKTTAEKFLYEKSQIIEKLRKYGIQTVYTKPEELNINSINKYLEIKAKGML